MHALIWIIKVVKYLNYFHILQGGRGLHSTLNTHSKKFIGILNGIDTDTWNPATDSHIEMQYNSSDLLGKEANKLSLRKNLGLLSSDSMQPLVFLLKFNGDLGFLSF